MSESGEGKRAGRKDVLTTFEASRYLNVAPKTVSNWIDAGHLKAYRTVGGHRRIRREDLEAFISAQQSTRRPRPVSQRRRVLVVNDEAAVVEAILGCLREADPQCEVEVARSAFEAGMKMARFAPDLVILDLAMPGLRGAEVCTQIHAQADTREARIVVLGAHAQPELLEEAMRQGASRGLARPLDPAQFKKEVLSLLGSA